MATRLMEMDAMLIVLLVIKTDAIKVPPTSSTELHLAMQLPPQTLPVGQPLLLRQAVEEEVAVAEVVYMMQMQYRQICKQVQ